MTVWSCFSLLKIPKMKTTHHFERLGKRLLGKNKVCWGGKEGLGRISKLKQVFSCLFFSFVLRENWCYPAELAVNFQQKRRVSFCLQVDPRLSPSWCFQKGRILELNRKKKRFSGLTGEVEAVGWSSVSGQR